MWNLLIGAVFIIGGVSGSMVMKGTESGLALAGLGVLLCIWGVFQLSSGGKKAPRSSRTAATTRRSRAADGGRGSRGDGARRSPGGGTARVTRRSRR